MQYRISSFIAFLAGLIALGTTGCPQSTSSVDGLDGLLGGSGENTGNTGGTNGGNNGASGTLRAVRSTVACHVQAMVRAGNDVIAFGTGGAKGVSYIVPSGNDAAARTIPGSAAFNSYSLAVGGRNIFLTDGNFQVSVFNVDTHDLTPIDLNEVRLQNIPASQLESGHIQADGNYCAVICDASEVSDSVVIKAIDVSTGLPNVISFTAGSIGSAAAVQMVAVNNATQQVIAATSDSFFIFDITNPAAPPVQFPAGPNGIGATQMQFDGTHVLFHDAGGAPSARVLNVSTGAIAALAQNPSSASSLALRDGSFGYFVDRDASDSLGSQRRAGIGTISAAAVTTAADGDFIDGSSANNGQFGFGQSIAISPNGSTWFLAGSEIVGAGEYLQFSGGGTFATVADPSGVDELGCPATDVVCGDDVLAFKTGSGSSTVIGYVRINPTTATSSASAQR